MKFDRVSYTANLTQWKSDFSYQIGDMVSHNGKGYKAKRNHSAAIFTVNNFDLINESDYTNAADRVAATYYPGKNQIPREVDITGNISLARLIPGTTDLFNKVKTDDSVFNESKYESPTIGNTDRPEDINVSGGEFYDLTKSFAPEELVPGTTLDSLQITVSTLATVYEDDVEEGTEVKYLYKIIKDNNNYPKYYAVSPIRKTVLAQKLSYNDKLIYLSDLAALAAPVLSTKVPGRIIINGEIIQFWHIDPVEKTIIDPIRGVDGTAIPVEHPAGTEVIDNNENLKLPDTSNVLTSRFVYTADKPIFETGFSVNSNYEMTKNLLRVYNGITLLELGKDYTFEINATALGYRAAITFVNAADFLDGIRFSAEYLSDRIWLNQGATSVTDGTGLAGSSRPAAEFIKQFPHNL
jgi:hypothetical protein